MVRSGKAVAELVTHRPSMVTKVVVGRESPLASYVSAQAEKSGIPVAVLQKDKFKRQLGRATHSVVAICRPFDYASLEDLLRARGSKALLVAIDSLHDPGNLGAIIRNGVFFGAVGFILQERRCVHVTSTVIERSAGAVAKAQIAKVTNLSRALKRAKEFGYWVIGSAPEAQQNLQDVNMGGRCCIVLGSEEKGIRTGARKMCDFTVRLEGKFESLNVASFSAIFMYQWWVMNTR